MHIMNSTPMIDSLLCLVFLFLAVWNQTNSAVGDCGIARLSTVLLNKIEALQTMKCCTAKRCYAVVNFSFVMFWANVYSLCFFFCAINPAKSVRRYNSNMQLHYSAVNSWLTIPTFPQVEIIQANSPGPCVIPWAFHEHFSFFEEV